MSFRNELAPDTINGKDRDDDDDHGPHQERPLDDDDADDVKVYFFVDELMFIIIGPDLVWR